MKKIMMIAAMMAMTIAAKAQGEVGSFSIKPMIGFSLTSVTNLDMPIGVSIMGSDQTPSGDIHAGGGLGVEAEYRATSLLGVSVGLMYSLQGKGYNNFTFDASSIAGGSGEYGWKDAKIDLEYINIPILANFHIGNSGFAIKAGVQPSFLTKANVKYTRIAGSQETKIDNDCKDSFKTFDLSIPIGASYEFGGGWTIDARYNWGVTKINKEGDESMKNSVFMVAVGYNFHL